MPAKTLTSPVRQAAASVTAETLLRRLAATFLRRWRHTKYAAAVPVGSPPGNDRPGPLFRRDWRTGACERRNL